MHSDAAAEPESGSSAHRTSTRRKVRKRAVVSATSESTLAQLRAEVDERIEASVQASEARILRTLAQELVKAKLEARETEVPPAVADDDDFSGLVTADKSDIANMYSYAVERILLFKSVRQVLFNLASVAAMLVVQVVYAFAFCDSSQMLHILDYVCSRSRTQTSVECQHTRCALSTLVDPRVHPACPAVCRRPRPARQLPLLPQLDRRRDDGAASQLYVIHHLIGAPGPRLQK